MKDLEHPKYLQDVFVGETKKSALILVENEKQGLHQWIDFSENVQSSNSFKLMKLSMKFFVETNTENSKFGIAYFSIRYKNSQILPIYLRTSKFNEWAEEVVYVPNFGANFEIENILVSFSVINGPVKFYVENISVSLIKNEKIENYHEKMIKRRPQEYHTRLFAFSMTAENIKKLNPLSVSIITQLSVNRLTHLQKLLKTSQGTPIVASMYLTSQDDYEKVQSFWNENYEEASKSLVIHLVFDLNLCSQFKEESNFFYSSLPKHSNQKNIENGLQFFYPINFLRNLGRKHCFTQFILYLDVDFVPSLECSRNLQSADEILKIFNKIGQKTHIFNKVFVLPAYKWIDDDKDDILNIKIPKNKEELLFLMNSSIGKIKRIPYLSSSFVDYNHWESITPNSKNVFYKIEWPYQLHFEPYFIAPKSIPLFPERFIGGGRDKLIQTLTTHLSLKDHEFWVHPQWFIVHLPHPEGSQPLMPGWPPKDYLKLVVISNYWMSFKEIFEMQKIDQAEALFEEEKIVLASKTFEKVSNDLKLFSMTNLNSRTKLLDPIRIFESQVRKLQKMIELHNSGKTPEREERKGRIYVFEGIISLILLFGFIYFIKNRKNKYENFKN